MNLMKTFFHFLFFLFLLQRMNALGFEGMLTITRQTNFDTVHYILSVQNNFVRIDQQNSHKQIVQSLIIDLASEKITALSPDYKLYTSIHTKCPDLKKGFDFQIIRSNNYKYINGYKCFLYRARNDKMNIEMSFWVYDSGLLFFQKAIKLLSCTEDYSNIFYMFSEIATEGALPILSVERTLLRVEKSKTIITDFTSGKINPTVFKIPEDYRYLRY